MKVGSDSTVKQLPNSNKLDIHVKRAEIMRYYVHICALIAKNWLRSSSYAICISVSLSTKSVLFKWRGILLNFCLDWNMQPLTLCLFFLFL